ncbi:MAG: hypothetical protein ACK5K7_02595 [Bacilli bacterium]
MVANILKAEFYKQYSKKTAFILPIIVFIIFLFLPLSLLLVAESMDLGYSMNAGTIMLFLTLIIALYIAYLFVIGIIPIMTPINIYGQDYNNNVIANTIASGGKRSHIFWSKYLIANIHITIYFIAAFIGALISLIVFELVGDNSFAEVTYESLGQSYDALLSFLTVLNAILGLFLTTSLSILAITLTKNFVGAFFTTLGFLIVCNIPGVILMNSYLADTIAYGTTNAYFEFTISIIFNITFGTIALICALLRFLKTDY